MRFIRQLGALLLWLGIAQAGLAQDMAAEAGTAEPALLEAQCDHGEASACVALGERLLMAADGAPQDEAGAFALFDKACYTLDDPEGCFSLGIAWAEGIGVAANPIQSLAAHRKACTRGHAGACRQEALAFYEGRGTAESPAGAFELFARACRLGLASACTNQGNMHAKGEGTPTDEPAARARYLEACELGDAEGCYLGGEYIFQGRGGTADSAQAVELYRQGCDLGEASACERLGQELSFPDFGEADAAGAEAAFARACALGRVSHCVDGEAPPSPEAPVLTAVPMAEDIAGPQDAFASEALPDLEFGMEIADQAETAAPALEEDGADMAAAAGDPEAPSEDEMLADERRMMGEACSGGDLGACEMYAAWLRDGTGGAEDRVRARRIFSVICTEGSVKGCYELAWMMYDAGTSDLEMSRARFLFTDTCQAGVTEACLQAADMRLSGEGGRQDRPGAVRMLAMACEDGQVSACDQQAELEARLEEPALPAGFKDSERAAASNEALPAE